MPVTVNHIDDSMVHPQLRVTDAPPVVAQESASDSVTPLVPAAPLGDGVLPTSKSGDLPIRDVSELATGNTAESPIHIASQSETAPLPPAI